MQPFIGTDDLAAILGQAVNENDLITEIALDSGCTAVRSFLGQTINFVANDTEIKDGHGTKKIRLKERPVRALTAVRLDGAVVDPSLYNLKDSTIRRVDDERWPVAYANIQVDYSHGYDVQPDTSAGDDVLVPADMRLVALLSARRVYAAIGNEDGIKQSETIGQYSYSNSTTMVVQTAAELLKPETDVLHRYLIGIVPAR
jgi:hypothetical protein